MKVLRVALLAAVCVSWIRMSFAQEPAADTREEVIAAEQREKARVAAPFVPGRAEALFQRFEERGFPFVGTPPGPYPALGSVYPGGGFALGAGYRKFTGDYALIDVHAMISFATYKRIEATFRSPGHSRGRLEFASRVGWLDAPRIAYFGVGAESDKIDRTAFRLRETYAETGVSWRARKWLQLGASGGYESFREDSGTGRSPSIENRFDAVTAPRLNEDPVYAKLTTAASLLWLDTPAYSRHGGSVRWTYDARARLDDGGGFGLTRTEVVQHIPILRENWVISLRARADAVVGDGDNAPYFLLPGLGSGSTLRAYSTDRFRDRHSVLFSGEWRWIPSRLFMDMALFADAGRVGPTWNDVTSGRLKKDVGMGVRFHTPAATALRIEVARGSEGLRLVFTTSAPF
jgi:hypothetical protein